MKDNMYLRIFQILCPFAIYLAIYNIGYYLLAYFLPLPRLGCLLGAGAAALVVEGVFYNRLQRQQENQSSDINKYLFADNENYSRKVSGHQELLWMFLTLSIGIAMNLVALHLPLEKLSDSYRSSAAVLFGAPIWLQIVANVLVIPLLEEIVFRGIIAGQLTDILPERYAILLSALLFGMVHFNMIQFLYALGLGLLLGKVYLQKRHLMSSYLCHGLLNLIVILYTAEKLYF